MSVLLKVSLVVLGVVIVFVGVTAFRINAREASAERDYPPVGTLLDVSGRPVHAIVEGQGPDLILLHGAGGNARDFTFDLVPRLSDRFRVIAFDRPGFGHTGHPADAAEPSAESPREQARFLQQAADVLGVETPIVLGHSYGGAVALAWALERPSETGALVLIAAASMPWPGELDPLYGINASRLGGAVVVPLISAFATRGIAESVLVDIFAPDPIPNDYIDHLGIPLTLRRSSQIANARQVNTLRPHLVEMSEDYAALEIPVELVHGEADEIVPASVHSIPLSGRLPLANLTLLPGIGHMPQHAATETILAAIDRAAERAQR
ncbi:MAG: alpha/beta fold hydrolase [Pseudomonadota bacterium]